MSFEKIAAATAVLGCIALAVTSTPADAQFKKGEKGWNKEKDKQQLTEVTKCAAPIGTVAIEEPENQWWLRYNLASPERLIKVMATRSNCLRVVDRSRGLAMREREQGLAERGQLQRRSNVGAAQIKSADYFIVPDMITADANSKGSAFGAIAGGLIGGTAGGILGGLRTNVAEAQVSIGLIDARTTEEVYTAEGTASKRDTSFAVGAGIGGVGGAGGGYEDTDMGRVVSIAYLEAFNNLVAFMQTQSGDAVQKAPQAALNVVRATNMRASAAPTGKSIRTLEAGDIVYPTGQTSPGFVEVEDEFDAKGWVPSSSVSQRATVRNPAPSSRN